MRYGRNLLIFGGLSLALWLALDAPGLEFARRAWVPLVGWLVLGLLAVSPRQTSSLAGVDPATYGMVAVAWSTTVLGLGALVAAGSLLVARWSERPGAGWERWATSPILGGVFVLVVLAAVVPMTAMTNRRLGAAGTTPQSEQRGDLRSHPAPTRNADAWRDPDEPRT